MSSRLKFGLVVGLKFGLFQVIVSQEAVTLIMALADVQTGCEGAGGTGRGGGMRGMQGGPGHQDLPEGKSPPKWKTMEPCEEERVVPKWKNTVIR